MTQLPGAATALVEETKVLDYLLNSGHPQNGGKSAYFQAFGFCGDQWTVMRNALIDHATVNHIAGSSQSPHGTKHTVRCSIQTPDRRNPCITTVWIVDGSRPPRLVTCYP